MSREAFSTDTVMPRTLAICAYNHKTELSEEHYQEEFAELLQTAGIKEDHRLNLRLRMIDNTNFFTKGKLHEVLEICEQNEIEEIVISQPITPMQERNLEAFLNCRVFGRAELILEIFKLAAHSSEGKIQVEMAELEFMKTRLAGRGKELAQQEGFVGSRGPGETEKELLKRYYADKMRQARKRLETLQRTRETQRKKRLLSGLPLVCLVGYTNAGKSSLLNRLTKSQILAEDKLFATLDTTTRELCLGYEENGKPKIVLLSDTVGFISQLPHHLIEAFKSTLDELRYADILLHVVDKSNPAWPKQIQVVNKTLEELNIKANQLYIFNKDDKPYPEELDENLPLSFEPALTTSALAPEGVKPILKHLQDKYSVFYPLEQKGSDE